MHLQVKVYVKQYNMTQSHRFIKYNFKKLKYYTYIITFSFPLFKVIVLQVHITYLSISYVLYFSIQFLRALTISDNK